MLYSNTCKVQMSCMCHAHAMHVPMPMQATCTACTRTWAHAMHMHMHTPCACHAHAMHMRMHLVDEGRVGHQGVALDQAGAPVLAGRADRPSQRDPVDMVWLLHLRRATLERLRVRHEVAAEVAVLRWIDREIDSWVSRAVRLARYTVPRCWAPHNPDTQCTVYTDVVSLSAVLREKLKIPRSRQLHSDGRLARSRRTAEEDQRPGSCAGRRGDNHSCASAAPTERVALLVRRFSPPITLQGQRDGGKKAAKGTERVRCLVSRQHRVPRRRSVPKPIKPFKH